MFDRVEIKERGKAAFRRNFWKCVLVALILALFVDNFSNSSQYSSQTEISGTGTYGEIEEFYEESPVGEMLNGGLFHYVPTLRGALSALSIVMICAVLLLHIFVFAPLEVGGCRFFCQNKFRNADIGEILSPFRSGGDGYLNSVLVLFLRDLKIFLWTLLFIIPGIIKTYEYRMVPYLLAEFPEKDQKEIFEMSRQMMYGAKMDAFLLDLSFIGWYLLGVLTFGIVNIFWTNPYAYAANAELYFTLRDNQLRGNQEF